MFRHVIYSNVAFSWDLNSWLESLAGVLCWLAGIVFSWLVGAVSWLVGGAWFEAGGVRREV